MAPVTRGRKAASKPTACQPKPQPKYKMIELKKSKNKKCMLCRKNEISEKLYGQLYQLNGVVVHYFCILLSSQAVQNGEDDEGIWGFLLKDINDELARASKTICYYCHKNGASIACCEKNCEKVFHLPCGLNNGSMHQYFNSFKSFCNVHRIPQIIDTPVLKQAISTECTICKDAVIPTPNPTSIWAPCCKRDAWFHRECVQDLALSAGYFFKCPLCNDVDKFKSVMLTLGIYIPSRDASWETVPNAFAELTWRPSNCSIETCLCPHETNRKFQHTFGSWEILLCNSCGSNGTHRLCSSITGEQEWCCAVCKVVKDKDAIKKKKIRLELLDNETCGSSSGMFEEQVPSRNREVSQRLSELMRYGNQPESLDDDNSILILDSDDSNQSSVQCISDDEPNTHFQVEQANTHFQVEQANTHFQVEQANTHFQVEQANTHFQVEQTPRIQLPIISSYGSISTGFFRNYQNLANQSIPPISIDLTGDDDINIL